MTSEELRTANELRAQMHNVLHGGFDRLFHNTILSGATDLDNRVFKDMGYLWNEVEVEYVRPAREKQFIKIDAQDLRIGDVVRDRDFMTETKTHVVESITTKTHVRYQDHPGLVYDREEIVEVLR